jgi:hypothetical protein
MKATRVQYTVRADYVATNEANIQAVMEELRAKGEVGVKYSAYRTGDGGRTFVHLVVAKDEESISVVPRLAAFQTFREGLSGGAESPPQVERWDVVGTSFDV